jgi:hypothetical protein
MHLCIRPRNDTLFDTDTDFGNLQKTKFTNAAYYSRTYNSLNEDYGYNIMRVLESHKVDWYFHNWSVSPKLYKESAPIDEFYSILATATDKEE